MRGSGPSPALVALLCLGTLPKPAIWADPGPVVTEGSPVTLWCQGSLQAEFYRLYRDGGSEAMMAVKPHSPGDKGRFHFKSMGQHRAGRYQCDYHSSLDRSERSEPLALVVTGVYPAPALSAQPSPVVAAGGNVTLTCSSRDTAGTFYLLKEGGADPPRQRNASFLEGRHQALFPVGPANPSHEVTYRCYHESQTDPYVWSAPSTPLRLEVTGAYGEPSLWAEPGAPVLPGGSLTLRCGAQAGFGRFALARGEGPPRRLDGQRSPDFPLGPVSRTHGGRYRCYGGRNLSHAWSAPSAPLDVLIAGEGHRVLTGCSGQARSALGGWGQGEGLGRRWAVVWEGARGRAWEDSGMET
ncbi:Leukocyte immunoglobulin-like receptor subfamily A member 6, partial [Galemys pyrenaicus]